MSQTPLFQKAFQHFFVGYGKSVGKPCSKSPDAICFRALFVCATHSKANHIDLCLAGTIQDFSTHYNQCPE